MKVLGMGNALVDVLAIIEDDKMLSSMELPKGSMQLIDESKFETLTKEISKLKSSVVSGGSAANTIVGLAKLNIATGFVGRIGKDKFGQYYKDDLKKHGVAPLLSEVDETSGVASTFISKDGERTFGTYLGAAALLNVEDLKPEDFAGYDYFYIEGYLVQNYDLIRKAIELAKDGGAKIILDLASYNVVEANRDFLLNIIPRYVDIVFSNEEEAKALLGSGAKDAVSVLAKDVEIAIVKTGEQGSWIQRGNEKVQVPAYKVNCIDTTGAGDLYAAGFIYGLINNLLLDKCGQIGSLLASEVIQVIGAKIEENKWEKLVSEITEIKN